MPRKNWSTAVSEPRLRTASCTAERADENGCTRAGSTDIWQYAPSHLDVTLNGQPAALTIETGYPDTGQVTVRVDHAGPAPSEIALRVPAWCHDAHGHIATGSSDGNGQAPSTSDTRLEAGTLWRVNHRWQPGDQITLTLEMPPQLTVADPRIDAVRGCAAVERGPLVYCLEETDTGTPEHLEAIRQGDAETLTPASIQINHEPITVLRGHGHTQPPPPPAAAIPPTTPPPRRRNRPPHQPAAHPLLRLGKPPPRPNHAHLDTPMIRTSYFDLKIPPSG